VAVVPPASDAEQPTRLPLQSRFVTFVNPRSLRSNPSLARRSLGEGGNPFNHLTWRSQLSA